MSFTSHVAFGTYFILFKGLDVDGMHEDVTAALTAISSKSTLRMGSRSTCFRYAAPIRAGSLVPLSRLPHMSLLFVKSLLLRPD